MSDKRPDLAGALGGFRKGSIQRKYTYLVEFLDGFASDLIKPHQIVSVNNQITTYTKEVWNRYYFPIAVPKYESDGKEVALMLQEDGFGNVRSFIENCIKRVRREDGLYNPPKSAKLEGIRLNILNASGQIVDIHEYRGLLYMSAEPVTFGYEDSGALFYSMMFSCDDVVRDPDGSLGLE